MKNYANTFTAEYENTFGKIVFETFVAPNLEDATIEATNTAEERDWELLSIDYTNRNC